MHSNEFVGEHLILKNVSVLFRFSAIWISFSFELMKTLAKCHWMKLVQENHIKESDAQKCTKSWCVAICTEIDW